MQTPTAAADLTLWMLLGDELELAALPLPGRAPSLADVAAYESEALAVCRLQERAIARSSATVRPARMAS